MQIRSARPSTAVPRPGNRAGSCHVRGVSHLTDLSSGSAQPASQGNAATVGGDDIILELRDLEKRYGHIQALKRSTLAFRRGEIHAIVGENGAGKSTLIKLLTGVIRRSGVTIVRRPPSSLL